MLPSLRPGAIIVAVAYTKSLRCGDLVVVHHDGLEKVKRVYDVNDGYVYILGDNPDGSTDSRSFGWLPSAAVKGRVIWRGNPLRRI